MLKLENCSVSLESLTVGILIRPCLGLITTSLGLMTSGLGLVC